jgi:CheY-like chemotaxis protein/anti-sigma regulatory factor (Ser/Thr protein kinase)
VKLIAGAERASLRARDLTNQLLTFAKGGVPIRRKTTTLEGLLRDSATFALSGSRCTCTFRIDGDLWPVEIDDTQISRVFQNLVINADQSMPGGGEIVVRASNHSEDGTRGLLPPGRYLRIQVEDHGLGIPEEHLAHIFEPYFTTKTEGSGFGLPISYSIVRRHGGILTVRSEPGRGSTFGVFLPASADTVAAPLDRQPPDALAPRKGRILVVDDEEMVRDFLMRALPTLGCEADAVADGADAVARYREGRESARPYDLVLMDLTIAGGMGGLEATSHIRALDPEARVIVSSGYSDDPVMAEHERFGFCGVLQKPYRIDRLSTALARALGARS